MRWVPCVCWQDGQVPIGQGQSISAPSLHAVMLELVAGHAREGAVVMDVGTGGGAASVGRGGSCGAGT